MLEAQGGGHTKGENETLGVRPEPEGFSLQSPFKTTTTAPANRDLPLSKGKYEPSRWLKKANAYRTRYVLPVL